jgi:APA family basic amino acid/polyamine antiporter
MLLPEHSSSTELPRTLDLLDATMINIGSMIGSGIFIVPAAIALHLDSTLLIVLVWLIGGVVSLFGALSMAELGALMPRAGGQFVYLCEAYGPLVGFLYGWTLFIVIQTAAIAAVAVGFARYLGFLLPLDATAIRVVAIASIVLLTAINCYGAKLGAVVQNIFTFLKVGALAAIVVASFTFSGGSSANFNSITPTLQNSSLLNAFALALVGVLWSYDGWIEITYIAGEVKHPERNIPRSLLISTLVVMGFYIVVNLAFIYVLGVEKVAASSLVASDAATVIHGSIGAGIVAATVAVSMFGANNGFVFTGSRMYYAMARAGLFFRSLGSIHPRFETPVASLLAQGAWSCLLVLSGTYDQLIAYIIFASFLFYAMSCAAVIILRRRSPDALRPYKTWGYPLTPIVFILFAVALTINTIVESPSDAAIGCAMILAGIPAYWWWKKNTRGEVGEL